MLQLLKSLGKNCIEDDFSSNSSEIFKSNATLETLVPLYYFCRFDSVKIQVKMLFNVFVLNSCLTDSNTIVMMVVIQIIMMMLIVMTILMMMTTVMIIMMMFMIHSDKDKINVYVYADSNEYS